MTTDETYIREAIDLSRRAIKNGNPPFGSLLVVSGSIVETETNTTVTDGDLAAHPEFKLAQWAFEEFSPEQRRECTMYTSTEPCAMCASAIHYARLGRVVYSIRGDVLGEIRGDRGIDIPCGEVVRRANGSTVVDGPVLEAEGLAVHEDYY